VTPISGNWCRNAQIGRQPTIDPPANIAITRYLREAFSQFDRRDLQYV